MRYGRRYAGYARPKEVLHDAVLTPEEKLETLKHWQATVRRHGRTASPGDPDLAGLLSELEAARAAIDRGCGNGVPRTQRNR